MALNYILLGKRIKTIRKQRGLSQAKLSEMIDKTPTYVSYIEARLKRQSLDKLVLIDNALELTTDML